MVVFLVYRRKNEISSLLAPPGKISWLAVENSANAPHPGKKSFRCHASEQGWELCWHHVQFRRYQVQKTMICSSMVLVQLQVHRYLCRHARLGTRMQRQDKHMQHQFLDGVAWNFSYRRGWKITPFYKNGAVLHNLATLFDNTNAVSTAERVTRLRTVYSAKHLKNPSKLQMIHFK